MVTAVIGSIVLIFAELAGDRSWWTSPFPRDLRTWSVIVFVAATLCFFTEVPQLSRLFEIQVPGWRIWIVATLVAVAAVGWRAFWPHRDQVA